jgi:hypothetical protein
MPSSKFLWDMGIASLVGGLVFLVLAKLHRLF